MARRREALLDLYNKTNVANRKLLIKAVNVILNQEFSQIEGGAFHRPDLKIDEEDQQSWNSSLLKIQGELEGNENGVNRKSELSYTFKRKVSERFSALKREHNKKLYLAEISPELDGDLEKLKLKLKLKSNGKVLSWLMEKNVERQKFDKEVEKKVKEVIESKQLRLDRTEERRVKALLRISDELAVYRARYTKPKLSSFEKDEVENLRIKSNRIYRAVRNWKPTRVPFEGIGGRIFDSSFDEEGELAAQEKASSHLKRASAGAIKANASIPDDYEELGNALRKLFSAYDSQTNGELSFSEWFLNSELKK